MDVLKRCLVAPSILSANFTKISEAIAEIERAGGDWVHLDVMDGTFVPNITFGPKMVGDIRPLTRLPLDVHLMIEHPETMLREFADAGADHLTFHIENTIHAHRTITEIQSLGIKAGISIVPSTPVSAIEELLGMVDIILVMTVNPGFGGQELIPRCLEKVRALDALRRDNGYRYLISVDGGINRETVEAARDAGSDVLISGSSFFAADDPSLEVMFFKGQKFA